MVFGSSEYAEGVNEIKNTEIRVIVGEGDTCMSDSRSFGVDVVNNLLGDGPSHRSHLIREIHPDLDIARSVIDRMMRYVEELYPSWTNEIARVAMGVVLMSLPNDITSHDLVRFLHLAQGVVYLRSRFGHTFLYENGAFRLPNGVMPESETQKCKEYASYVVGSL